MIMVGFYGANEWERAQVDAIADQHVDFGFDYGRWHVVNVGYAPGDKVSRKLPMEGRKYRVLRINSMKMCGFPLERNTSRSFRSFSERFSSKAS